MTFPKSTRPSQSVWLSSLIMAAASLIAMPQASAQNFPSKTMSMIVGFPAGGASDHVGRVLAKEMGAGFNQPFIVENVVGVGGSLGVLKVTNAAPDGYTVIAGSPLELILTPLGIAAAKNKPEDVRMVAMAGRTSMALVTRKDLNVNSFEEFIALIKKSDKPLSYGSTGVGSLYHLMGEKLSQIAGVKTLHVPYAGLAPFMQNLAGGHIDFAFAPIAGPVPGFIENGSIKAMAVSAQDAVPRFPKLPLIKSSKGYENFVFSIWAGLQTSAKVPDAAVATLHKSAYAALAKPEVRQSLEAAGFVMASPMSVSELNQFYVNETAMYQAIAKSIKATLKKVHPRGGWRVVG